VQGGQFGHLNRNSNKLGTLVSYADSVARWSCQSASLLTLRLSLVQPRSDSLSGPLQRIHPRVNRRHWKDLEQARSSMTRGCPSVPGCDTVHTSGTEDGLEPQISATKPYIALMSIFVIFPRTSACLDLTLLRRPTAPIWLLVAASEYVLRSNNCPLQLLRPV
jgi:hypothetical protein